MAALNVQMQVSGIEAAIASLNAAARVAETEELADALGVLGVGQTQRRIQSEKTTPGGQPWKPNLSGTPILFRSGSHLSDSMDHVVRGASEVAWGTGWIGARVHQFGATIRPVNAKALHFAIGGKHVAVKQVTIPAREYLGVSADNARELQETAEKFVAKVLS